MGRVYIGCPYVGEGLVVPMSSQGIDPYEAIAMGVKRSRFAPKTEKIAVLISEFLESVSPRGEVDLGLGL